VILDELDLGREAANASQLRRNFADSNLVYVPEVFWDYTGATSWSWSASAASRSRICRPCASAGELKVLGERGVEIFFTQVFRDSFFHADMHPGNIFVDASDPGGSALHRHRLRDHRLAERIGPVLSGAQPPGDFRRDYHEVAQLHVECGWVPPDTRVQDFESAMRAVCEPVFERPIAEISFGQLLVYLFRTAARFDMQVQPSLVLLQKTLLNIEGLGRQLYPN
jgi:ubiquinone biosynthesis protein